MNEKGRQTKLLAAIAVLAMVVCAFAVVSSSDNVSAAYDEATDGPFNFADDVNYGETYGVLNNNTLSEGLSVTYDADTKTYTVTGTLLYQAEDKNGAFYKLWENNTTDHYGLAFQINIDEGSVLTYGEDKTTTADKTGIQFLYYLDGSEQTSLEFTVDSSAEGGATADPDAGKYTIDISEVAYATGVSNEAELKAALEDSDVKNIIITADINVSNAITIIKDVSIDGANHIITADSTVTWSGNGTKNIITINNGNVLISNVTFNSNDAAYGVNIYGSSTIATFNGVASNNSKGAGYVVSDATVNFTKVTATGFAWGGINFDKGAKVTIDSVDGVGSAYTENSSTSTMTFSDGENAPVEMTGKWVADGKEATDFKGYFSSIDYAKIYYNDEKIQKDATSGEALKITVNDNTTLTTDFTMTVGTLEVAKGATLVVSENTTLDVTKAKVAGAGEYLAASGSTISFAPEATPSVVVASGAQVTAGDKDVEPSDTANAATLEEAFELAGYGVPVTITEDITISTTDVSIPAGMDIRMADNKKVTLSQTNVFAVENSAFTGDVEGNKVTANVSLSGTYSLKAGSIDVDGRISGTIEEINGDLYISGTVDADLTISGTSGTVYFNNVTVNSNADVTIDSNLSYKTSGKFYLYGGLLISDKTATAEIEVQSNSEFKAFPNATISPAITITGVDSTSKIDLGEAMGTQYIRQDVTSDLSYSQTQTVIIEESIFIKKSATLTVNGQLIVNEGVEVIIEDGGELIVSNQTAKVTINGDIEVENGGIMNIADAESVDISGTVTSDGTLTINSNVTVENGGKILIENGDKSKFEINEGGKLTVEVGGIVDIRGQATVSDISNKGTVTLNGAVLSGTVKISMAANDAVVDIKSFSADKTETGTLVITDAGLIFKENKNPADNIVVSSANNMTISGTAEVGISGLIITESVTSEKVNKDTYYYNSFILSGSIAINDETNDGYTGTIDVTVFGPSIDVTEALTIGKNVKLTLTSGNLNVSGNITATADKAQIEATNGDINVSGMIETGVAINKNINAFHYSATVDGNEIHYYTTLKTAIDNGQTDIEALGATEVLESVDIPSGTQVKAGQGHESITIGSSDARDVVVTVKDDGEFRSCIIDVMGTLTFDNKRDDRNNTIYSDVFVEDDVSKSYTNIYTALNNAQSGETVTIYRSGSNVILDKDVTIKDGVTLDIPSGKGISVVDNVTVTVDGILKNSGILNNVKYDVASEAYVAGSGFNPETEDHATIDVNGTFMAVDEIPYADDSEASVIGYYIPGAYYNLVNTAGNWNYVTPVEDAAAVSNDVTDGEIDIKGTNQIGDVTFTGDENQPVDVTVMGKLTAGTITLVYATIDVADDTNNYQFDGTLATSVSSIQLVNSNGFTVNSTVDAEGATVMSISGAPAKADAEGADAKVTIATGNVSVVDTSAANDLDVTGAGFEISPDATLTVDGANAKMNAKDLEVNGTLVAYDGGNVTAENVYVIGTFTVSPADSDNGVQAGSATVTNAIRVGISDDFKTTTAAVLNAEKIGSWKNIYVSAESTVTEDLVKSKAFTQFYVEDALWFTVYANTTSDLKVNAPAVIPTENALLEKWTGKDVNGDDKTVNGGEEIIIGAVERFDANINYDIYKITVFADPGISAVYIDGKLMTSGYFANPLGGSDNVTMAAGFQAYVSAGNHEITYKLGNYFSGEAKMTVNGESVTGNTFTTSGMPENDDTAVDYVIYLQGIEASAPETPSTPSTSGDSGMGLTDYLLIILVILIVIMAIMVAFRLMRS